MGFLWPVFQRQCVFAGRVRFSQQRQSTHHCRAGRTPNIRSSAIINVGLLVLPLVIVGIAPASTTLRRWLLRTRSAEHAAIEAVLNAVSGESAISIAPVAESGTLRIVYAQDSSRTKCVARRRLDQPFTHKERFKLQYFRCSNTGPEVCRNI